MLRKMILGCVLLLGWSVAAHAQVGVCPEGMIPNGDQYNPNNCVPDPSFNPSQQTQQPMSPPPVWADRWGAIAIAVSSSPPAFGAAVDMPDERSAKAAALSKCETVPKATCSIARTYHNGCIAETWGDKIADSSTAPILSEAQSLSMAYCKAQGNTQCIPYYSACSYPVRVQ